MNRSDLISQLALRTNVPHKEAEAAVRAIFDTIAAALGEGERVEIRGFGSFSTRNYQGHQGRNPRTGSLVRVSPKRLPFFRVGKELRLRVNGPEPQ